MKNSQTLSKRWNRHPHTGDARIGKHFHSALVFRDEAWYFSIDCAHIRRTVRLLIGAYTGTDSCPTWPCRWFTSPVYVRAGIAENGQEIDTLSRPTSSWSIFREIYLRKPGLFPPFTFRGTIVGWHACKDRATMDELDLESGISHRVF